MAGFDPISGTSHLATVWNDAIKDQAIDDLELLKIALAVKEDFFSIGPTDAERTAQYLTFLKILKELLPGVNSLDNLFSFDDNYFKSNSVSDKDVALAYLKWEIASRGNTVKLGPNMDRPSREIFAKYADKVGNPSTGYFYTTSNSYAKNLEKAGRIIELLDAARKESDINKKTTLYLEAIKVDDNGSLNNADSPFPDSIKYPSIRTEMDNAIKLFANKIDFSALNSYADDNSKVTGRNQTNPKGSILTGNLSTVRSLLDLINTLRTNINTVNSTLSGKNITALNRYDNEKSSALLNEIVRLIKAESNAVSTLQVKYSADDAETLGEKRYAHLLNALDYLNKIVVKNDSGLIAQNGFTLPSDNSIQNLYSSIDGQRADLEKAVDDLNTYITTTMSTKTSAEVISYLNQNKYLWSLYRIFYGNKVGYKDPVTIISQTSNKDYEDAVKRVLDNLTTDKLKTVPDIKTFKDNNQDYNATINNKKIKDDQRVINALKKLEDAINNKDFEDAVKRVLDNLTTDKMKTVPDIKTFKDNNQDYNATINNKKIKDDQRVINALKNLEDAINNKDYEDAVKRVLDNLTTDKLKTIQDVKTFKDNNQDYNATVNNKKVANDQRVKDALSKIETTVNNKDYEDAVQRALAKITPNNLKTKQDMDTFKKNDQDYNATINNKKIADDQRIKNALAIVENAINDKVYEDAVQRTLAKITPNNLKTKQNLDDFKKNDQDYTAVVNNKKIADDQRVKDALSKIENTINDKAYEDAVQRALTKINPDNLKTKQDLDNLQKNDQDLNAVINNKKIADDQRIKDALTKIENAINNKSNFSIYLTQIPDFNFPERLTLFLTFKAVVGDTPEYKAAVEAFKKKWNLDPKAELPDITSLETTLDKDKDLGKDAVDNMKYLFDTFERYTLTNSNGGPLAKTPDSTNIINNIEDIFKRITALESIVNKNTKYTPVLKEALNGLKMALGAQIGIFLKNNPATGSISNPQKYAEQPLRGWLIKILAVDLYIQDERDKSIVGLEADRNDYDNYRKDFTLAEIIDFIKFFKPENFKDPATRPDKINLILKNIKLVSDTADGFLNHYIDTLIAQYQGDRRKQYEIGEIKGALSYLFVNGNNSDYQKKVATYDELVKSVFLDNLKKIGIIPQASTLFNLYKIDTVTLGRYPCLILNEDYLIFLTKTKIEGNDIRALFGMGGR